LVRIITILLVLLSSADIAHAEETKKISMAIMEFRANNTKEAFGKACVDMLSEKLFATNLFTLMEKSQMDRIARQNGFKEFNMIDTEQISRLGKVLNVDKIIVGSITYIDSFIIDVKILNASTGEIEFNVKRKIRSIEKLEDVLEDIAIAIERYYLGYDNLSGNLDIAVEVHYIYPFGLLGNAVNAGPGVQAVVQFNNPFDIPFNIQALTGYYSFTPGRDSMDYFYMFPVYLCTSHKFSFSRNMDFIPSAGIGYIFSKVSSGDSAETVGLYWEKNKLYHNPSFLIRTELDVLLYDRWYLVITPQYTIFFEKDKAGQFASIGIGLKMLF